MHGAFDRRSECCYLFVLLLLRVATFLPVAYIFIQDTLDVSWMKLARSFKDFKALTTIFKDFQGLEFLF